MLNKLFLKIFGLFDMIKDWFLHWGLRVLLVIFVLMILHNVLKMGEISIKYEGEYKKMVPVYEEQDKFMNSYVIGERKQNSSYTFCLWYAITNNSI